MKIAVYGAGAIGGFLAARLALAGHPVGVVARGPHLLALQRQGGLRLRSAGEERHAPLRAEAEPAALGPQDLVICTLKATALADFAAGVGPLLGPHTAVLFVQNGIPWWYAQGRSGGAPPLDAPAARAALAALDPGGALARAVAAPRVLGATIYTSNEVVEPGLVVNDSAGANTLFVAEPDDADTPRVQALRALLQGAGVGSPPVADIRATLWRRLLVNIGGSVVCSLIEQPIGVHQADPAMGALFARLGAEGRAIAAAHGVDVERGNLPPGGPYRFPPQHRPSFLQDYERHRPMEVQAILMTPLALARAAGMDVPALETVAALAAHRAARRGLYRPPEG